MMGLTDAAYWSSWVFSHGAMAIVVVAGKKTVFPPLLVCINDHLPRQARDNHEGISPKRIVFSQRPPS